MKEQDLQALESAARLIISVIERARIEDENREDLRKRFEEMNKFTSNREWWRNGGKLPPMSDVGERDHVLQEKEKPAERREEKGNFYITIEEIKKMSKSIKGKFYTQGFAVCWRKRQCGKNSFTYQVRFQRDGYNIQFHDKRKENLKPRFIEALKLQTEKLNAKNGVITSSFSTFALFYFEKFRKLRVTEGTYTRDLRRLKKHILPFFEDRYIELITPTNCQTLLDKLTEEGKGKTADEVFSLLNGIFNCAIKHHFIQYNPLDTVVHIPHERENGVALTPSEEAFFVERIKYTQYGIPFMVILYTGLRPCEYQTARIEDKFIVAVNSKRKTRKVQYKKIPISPMLRPYLMEVQTLSFPPESRLTKELKKLLPNHCLYDLRTTFNTRCKECHVDDSARKAFMGHSQGDKLANAYTDFSAEFLLKEGEKLKY